MVDLLTETLKKQKTWLKIYNRLCNSCRLKLIQSQKRNKSQNAEQIAEKSSQTKKVIESFCPRCKKVLEEEGYEF